MKRSLQIVLGILSLIPLYFGVTNLVNGAAELLPVDAVNAAIDSQFRFQSAIYLSMTALIWWIIPRLDRQTTIIRIIAGAIFIGGLGRLYSYMTVGIPPANMVAGMVLELAIPLLVIWHAMIRTDNQ